MMRRFAQSLIGAATILFSLESSLPVLAYSTGQQIVGQQTGQQTVSTHFGAIADVSDSSSVPSSSILAQAAPVPPTQPPTLQTTPHTPTEFRIRPVDGKVTIKLINTLPSTVFYRVIGEATPLELRKNTDITLTSLSVPVTLTFYRKDRKYIQVISKLVPDTPGVMEVTLLDTRDLTANKTALVIHRTGLFFPQ